MVRRGGFRRTGSRRPRDPGRGPAWKRTIHGDQLTPALEDQTDALHAAAARFADLDLSRVAIRGWSFGGFLAAAAVLHRPDVFHAAVAGAAPTDQRLYDTHWKERYLGHPRENTGELRPFLPGGTRASAAPPT
ncbi:prolyl oligopeptidase family serine peptidase [Streptomyces sp. Ac-502]|uniref:prolyl oligopeptidase family serine peptidase n=1 Tax=Streptomyces sp. Ac-502 TaxID=3342801 RepID=UPI0038626158